MVRDILTTRSRVRRWLAFGFLIASNLVVPLAHAAETVTYYYTNQQGTPLATADASGNILTTSDYRPYGGQVLGSPAGGPGYTGHVNDPDSGLVYMQARYYDPVVGRFLGTDPAGTQPGDVAKFGRFGYAVGNPARFVDPDGKQEDEDADAKDAEAKRIDLILRPLFGPNMAGPGYVPPPVPLPTPETWTDHAIAESTGLEPSTAYPGYPELNPMARGRANEARALEERGLTKNNEKVSSSEGNAIPDSKMGRDNFEVKDAKSVYGTRQLRIMSTATKKGGGQFNLITGKYTYISANAAELFDNIERDPTLGPQDGPTK